MVIVRKVLADVVTPNRGTFLSLGFLATLWTASGGFAAASKLSISLMMRRRQGTWLVG
jgi:uncharacterized BrkB/YihY/UPF0761 family membrane protein